ncbi:MAG TPA: ABC transporter ATP-binding protein [Propionibacteriaceae bacterium]|nr:ABC transporter ATP-binding protein [Propionibacteriaceae bacterium]
MNGNEALAVHAVGLGRSFGENRAVDGVDLTIPTGMIFGLLGPDGAGKSTLIRMLATVLAPDSGDATIFGSSVRRSPGRVIPRIGYMSQNFSMYPDLSVTENLDFFATLRGIGRAERQRRSLALLSAMGLAEFADMRARNLSGGMKQKLMLAATLMHEPDLLLLDEPTTGVDPVSRREFWRILTGLHRQGKTVLVATPYMEEAERCGYLAFLSGGRISREGSPAQIKAVVPGRLVEVTTPQPRAVLSALGAMTGVRSAHLYGDLVRALWTGDEPGAEELTARLMDMGLPVAAVRPARVDMEAAFAFLTESEHLPEAAQP